MSIVSHGISLQQTPFMPPRGSRIRLDGKVVKYPLSGGFKPLMQGHLIMGDVDLAVDQVFDGIDLDRNLVTVIKKTTRTILHQVKAQL